MYIKHPDLCPASRSSTTNENTVLPPTSATRAHINNADRPVESSLQAAHSMENANQGN
jgi:hypothetical protein